MRCLVFAFTLLVYSPIFTPAASASDLIGQNVGSNGDGIGLSLALRSDNTPAFTYFNQVSRSLKFTEWTGGAWQHSDIDISLTGLASVQTDSAISYYSPSALVYLGSVPHVIYYDSGAQKLVHAYRSGSSWIKDDIAAGLTAGGAPAAVTCGTSICVSYYNGSGRDLNFAKGNTGSWAISTVDSAGDVGSMSGITVKPDGSPAIVYYDATVRHPKTAIQNSSGGWSISTLSYLNHQFGLFPTLTASPDGTLYASFSRYRANATQFDTGLYFAKFTPGGSWDVSLVSDDYSGGPSMIRLDSASNPVVAYRYMRKSSRFGDAAAVMLAKLNPSGIWTSETTAGEYGTAGSIYIYDSINLAIATNGEPKIGYGFNQAAYVTFPATNLFRFHGSPVSSSATPATVRPSSTTTVPATSTPSPAITTSVPVTTVPRATTVPATTTINQTTTTTSVAATTSTTSVQSTTTTSIAPATLPLRIDAGGQGLIDPSGTAWLPDSMFTGGIAESRSKRINRTTGDKLYQTSRTGSAFSYSVPLAPGIYKVRLHFAELTASSAGKRVFNVMFEDSIGLQSFDIRKEVSRYTALVKTFYLAVTDGALNIGFAAITGDAAVGAIEILSVPADGLLINSGGLAVTDRSGQSWITDTAFTGGATMTANSAAVKSGSKSVAQSIRFGPAFGYRLPVPNGGYDVVLHFIEPTATGAGKRVFHCLIEGKNEIPNLDIFRLAGRNRELILDTTTSVQDGELNLDFVQAIPGHEPVISSIELHHIGH